jgi:hypothetical protein
MKRITRTEGLELFSNADLLGLGMLADKTLLSTAISITRTSVSTGVPSVHSGETKRVLKRMFSIRERSSVK